MPQVVKMQYLGEGKVWTTPSKTTPGKQHVTFFDPKTNVISCTCEGARYQKKCWHVDTIHTMLFPEDDTDHEEFQVNL